MCRLYGRDVYLFSENTFDMSYIAAECFQESLPLDNAISRPF